MLQTERLENYQNLPEEEKKNKQKKWPCLQSTVKAFL